MNNLDNIGKEIVERVRDEAIDKAVSVLNSRMKSIQATRISDRISGLSDEQKAAVLELIYLTVDSSLHNALWFAEDSSYFDLVFRGENDIFLSEQSDGLTGELYGDDGWIQKYSKYPCIY